MSFLFNMKKGEIFGFCLYLNLKSSWNMKLAISFSINFHNCTHIIINQIIFLLAACLANFLCIWFPVQKFSFQKFNRFFFLILENQFRKKKIFMNLSAFCRGETTTFSLGDVGHFQNMTNCLHIYAMFKSLQSQQTT